MWFTDFMIHTNGETWNHVHAWFKQILIIFIIKSGIWPTLIFKLSILVSFFFKIESFSRNKRLSEAFTLSFQTIFPPCRFFSKIIKVRVQDCLFYSIFWTPGNIRKDKIHGWVLYSWYDWIVIYWICLSGTL